jgi:PPK2 family polyphosphate:nucleotide phosphotransferase
MTLHDLRVEPGKAFHWKDHDARHRCGFDDRAAAEKQLAGDVARMIELQDIFYADARYGLLIIIQGVDAAGKDGIVKHVMSGLNPEGVNVYSFRAPSPDERAHDYLWRAARLVPPRGRISIFNRSYYEEVLICRVHPEFIAAQRLPPKLVGPDLWKERFEQMVAYERYLVHQGITVLKFFLHVSREEQLERLRDRIADPNKNWKFSPSDLETPQHWDTYKEAYEDMLTHTSSDHAHWYVAPRAARSGIPEDGPRRRPTPRRRKEIHRQTIVIVTRSGSCPTDERRSRGGRRSGRAAPGCAGSR